MNEMLFVRDMSVEHIEVFGTMLAIMVAESPRNYNITIDAAAMYGSGDRFLEGMTKAINENRVGRFVVVDSNEEILGAVTTSQKTDSLRIGNMYVKPSARLQGIGTLLLDACERRGIADNYPYTSLEVGSENLIARNFYEKHGYEPLDPPHIEEWDLHPGVFGEILVKKLTVH